MKTARKLWLFNWLERDARYWGSHWGYHNGIAYYTFGFWYFNIGIAIVELDYSEEGR